MDTYNETQRAITDVLEARDQARRNGDMRSGTNNNSYPAWIQLVLAVLAVVVTVVLAYGQLDKRISLMEQKLDYVVQRVGTSPR